MSKLAECLVSFCMAQESDVALELEAIAAFAAHCNEQLPFWEIVYVASDDHKAAIEASAPILAPIKNLRILLVRNGVSYYRRRALGAGEAIGDVVVLTCLNEMTKVDLLAFAVQALTSDRIVIGRKAGKMWFKPFTYWLADKISDYKVDSRDLKTVALPRNHLVTILARRTAPIDLRFQPKSGVVPYQRRKLVLSSARGEAGFKQRVELLAEIIQASAARFLTAFALVSVAVSVVAASYGVYAIIVFATRSDVQAGWFSTALAQSGSLTFLSIGLAVIALGIANIVDRLSAASEQEILAEIGNISFYDRINDINVEASAILGKAPSHDA